MTRKYLICLYFIAFLNLLFLTTVALLLMSIFYSARNSEYDQIFYYYLFVNTFIYIIYGVIFVLVFHEYKIKLARKGFITGLVSLFVFIIYPYTPNDMFHLLLILFLGFLLPFSQRMISRIIITPKAAD